MFLGRYGSKPAPCGLTSFYSHLFGHAFEQMIALRCGFGRRAIGPISKLRFVFLESGCGWLPYWLYRLDEHYEVLGNQVPDLKAIRAASGTRAAVLFCEGR
jgi:hypothetical protein